MNAVPNFLRPSRLRGAFTLIELLVVVAIIGTLAALLFPVVGKMMEQSHDTKCTNNLRQLGIIIHTVAVENNSTFPQIENDPAHPIHTDAQGKVWTLPELVTKNGASLDLLKCPSDVSAKLCHPPESKSGTSYFASKGSSYEWFPLFEGVSLNAPSILTPMGSFNVPLSRVRLLMDYAESGEAPHTRTATDSVMHVFYADGSVQNVTLSKE